MIDSFTVSRYRSFLQPATVELRELTLLFGYNNAGKSALLRTLPLLASSINKGGPSPLDLKSDATRQATFEDLRCRLGGAPGIAFELKWHGNQCFGFTIRDLRDRRRQVVSDFFYQSGSDRLGATWLPDHEGRRLSQHYEISKVGPVPLEFEAFLPRTNLDTGRNWASQLETCRSELIDIASKTYWLSMRSPPRRAYAPGGSSPRRIEHDGEGFADTLFYDQQDGGHLLQSISSWFEQHFDLVLGISDRDYLYILTLDPASRPALGINLADTGEGMGQVLPVLVALEKVRAEGGLLALEQPELHLHPAAEEALARRVVEVASSEPAPKLLIETHSENFMLAVQLAIATGDLSPDRVNAYWFEKLDDGQTHLRELHFDDQGRVVGGWPRGVFSEDTEQARQLYLARQSQRRRPQW